MLQPGVKESTATTGTGTVTLSAITGFVRLAQAFAVGQPVSYVIEDGNDCEWGYGAVGASNTLVRTLVLATLVSGTFNNTNPSAITLSGDAVVSCQQHTGSVVGPYLGARLNGAISGGLSNNLMPANMIADSDYGTVTLTANNGYFYPVLLLCSRPISQLGVRVSTLASGKVCAIGLFDTDPSNGGPGNTLAEVSGLSVATTGELMASLSNLVTLAPGWYWAGIVSDGAPALNGPTTMMPGPLGMLSNRSQRYMNRSNTYAAFGATAFANVTGSIGNVQNTNVPMVLYK